jgi:hypothetical protein
MDQQLREKLDLWIPSEGFNSDLEFDYYCQSQLALNAFCRGEMKPSELLDRLYGYGCDMDSYEEAVTYNLNH